LAATRSSVNLHVKEGAALGSRRRSWVRRGLVAAQISLSLILVTTAGLFAKSLSNLRTMNTGYDRRGVLMADLNPIPAGYRGDRLYQFYDDVLRKIRKIPGVEAAGLASSVLLSGGGISDNITAEGATNHPEAVMTVVSDGYLEALGMRLVAGRTFNAADNQPKA